ncbi:MAG: YlxR family protein [Nitriliruptorales bacterium]
MSHPIRTCVACRRRRPQHELLRLAATPEGVMLDPERRRPGRGAYVCPEAGCLEAARRREGRALRRALRAEEADDVVDVLAAVSGGSPQEDGEA